METITLMTCAEKCEAEAINIFRQLTEIQQQAVDIAFGYDLGVLVDTFEEAERAGSFFVQPIQKYNTPAEIREYRAHKEFYHALSQDLFPATYRDLARERA